MTLKVSYRGPSEKTITGLGFWDGSNSFRIRCLFPEPGKWIWETACSDCCLALYNHHPSKPVINMEARYDSEFNEKQVPRLPRSCGYWAFLSGCAGYTYGCAGLFNWGLTKTHNDPQASLWDWRTAMTRQSSAEMEHLADFFRGVERWRLEPHHDLILNQADDPPKRMVLAKSAAGDLAASYLPDNPAIAIEMSSFPPSMQFRWFNPATGEAQAGQAPIERAARQAFERPAGWEDALLVLQQAPSR